MEMIVSDLYVEMINRTENYIQFPVFMSFGVYTLNCYGMPTLSIVVNALKDYFDTQKIVFAICKYVRMISFYYIFSKRI